MTLADRIVDLLRERGPLPACEIALELRRRKMDVLDALHSDPRFIHAGKRKASRWRVRGEEANQNGFGLSELARTPSTGCSAQGRTQGITRLTWPLDYDAGEEALVTLVREGRRSPEEALLLVVCAVNEAAAA